MGMYTTQASPARCGGCQRRLLHAWDDGLFIRADAAVLDSTVADALRLSGVPIYAHTYGGWLVRVPPEGAVPTRLTRTQHAGHVCPSGRS